MIETKRLKLTKFVMEDLDFVYKMNNDNEITKYLSYKSYSIEQCKNSIESWGNDEIKGRPSLTYKIIHKVDNKPIGLIGVIFSADKSSSELAYRIMPEYTKKGFATEACLKLIEEVFNDEVHNIMYIETDPSNFASLELAKKLRFIKIKEASDSNGVIFSYERN